MKGDKGSGVPQEKKARSDIQPEIDIPWSANAPYEPDELAASEQADRWVEQSPDGTQFVPYCVMPHVERLLKVRMPMSLPCLIMIRLAYAWPSPVALPCLIIKAAYT